MAHSFEISATGSGNGGALVLSDGRRTIGYSVEFAPYDDPVLGEEGGTFTSSHGDCEHGRRAMTFVVVVDPEHVDEIQNGVVFTGVLTLIVAPT